MQLLDRLKMELSNQEYFIDERYIQFLRVKNNNFHINTNFPSALILSGYEDEAPYSNT